MTRAACCTVGSRRPLPKSIIEAFDHSGSSLGLASVNGVGAFNISSFFSAQPIGVARRTLPGDVRLGLVLI